LIGREIGNQETELVAAKPGGQVLLRHVGGTLLCKQIVRAYLLAQDVRDPFDDPVDDRRARRGTT
jgi:hypothetical protein